MIDSNHWRQCLRPDTPHREWDAILHAEIDRRCFWALLEWAETGEPGSVGRNSEDCPSWLLLYWDPINGFTGGQSAIDIVTNFRRTHP